MKKLKVDYYLLTIFLLIITVFKKPEYAFIIILPVLGVSYYRVIVKKDITVVLILMLIARLIMGPFISNSNLSFNILNLVCNYVPISIIVGYNLTNLKSISVHKIKSLKWTVLFVVFMVVFSFFNISASISIYAKEIQPLLLFLVVLLSNTEKSIDFYYLLNFFRYSFLACMLVYLNPNFYEQMLYLFSEGIIFKEATPDIALQVARAIPRNTGFVFDFRILGQLSCIYLIVLYYLGKKRSYWDVVLLSLVAILTFSRGPILILIILLLGIYAPKKIKITKRFLAIAIITLVMMFLGIFHAFNDDNIQKFVKSFNPSAKNNAISQRGILINYALNKFYERPFGNGIGSLSSSKADVKIFAGYTNVHKTIPDKVYYYTVTDAYLTMSLAEKGIIGFILLLFSFSEIFYSRKNRISLFFLIGFYINLIGTDIPKQGFYYFVIIVLYYSISEENRKNLNKNKYEALS